MGVCGKEGEGILPEPCSCEFWREWDKDSILINCPSMRRETCLSLRLTIRKKEILGQL